MLLLLLLLLLLIIFLSGLINENQQAGIRPILQIFATDDDLNTPTILSFSISLSSPFRINTTTGNIFSNEIIDAERNNEYRFDVLVTDNDPFNPLTSSTQIIIYVLDENDNIPSFTNDSYFVQVSESLSVGTTIIKVFANDDDTGSYEYVFTLIFKIKLY